VSVCDFNARLHMRITGVTSNSTATYPIAWATQICRNTQMAMTQSQLLAPSPITLVATLVILLLATMLLTLFRSVNIWKGFSSSGQRGRVQLRAVCAWPGYIALFPTGNIVGGRCVPRTIRLNDVTGLQTWSRLAMWPTCCLSPLPFAISQVSGQTQTFLKAL
jgi:hypothetical protein